MDVENEEIKRTELSNINQLDLSGGFGCDVDTGLCGPAEEMKKEKTEENKNENNDMV